MRRGFPFRTLSFDTSAGRSSSDAETDVVTSYDLHANCYLSKPVQLEAYENLVRSINDFWLIRVRLPPSGRHNTSA